MEEKEISEEEEMKTFLLILILILLFTVILKVEPNEPNGMSDEVWHPCSGKDTEPWAPVKICKGHLKRKK